MFSFLTDIVVGFFEFVMDVVLFRRQRRHRGRAERSLAEDAADVAHFDFVTLVLISAVSTGLVLVLAFVIGLPVGWSLAIGIAVGVAWGLWRYSQLLQRE